VQEELRADRGPDFYRLGPLMKDLGMNAAEQGQALGDLQDFLTSELISAVRQVEGVPREVR
jgi:hypothetical protein